MSQRQFHEDRLHNRIIHRICKKKICWNFSQFLIFSPVTAMHLLESSSPCLYNSSLNLQKLNGWITRTPKYRNGIAFLPFAGNESGMTFSLGCRSISTTVPFWSDTGYILHLWSFYWSLNQAAVPEQRSQSKFKGQNRTIMAFHKNIIYHPIPMDIYYVNKWISEVPLAVHDMKSKIQVLAMNLKF